MEAYYEHRGDNRTKVGLYLSDEDIERLKLHRHYFKVADWLNNPIKELVDMVLREASNEK
jgi:hypothetical protein